jgi:phosphoglycolate phosphatase
MPHAGPSIPAGQFAYPKVETPMTYRAVCFDLDGTLLDTLDDLADSMNRTLAANDLPTHPTEAYKYFVGAGMRMLAHRVLPDELKGNAEIEEKLFHGARDQYAKRWAEKSKPYEGIPEMLDELTRRGIRMAVLTNKPDDFAQLCVNELLPHWKFDIIQGVSETIPPKPDPTGGQFVTREFGIPAEEFLYVGDTAIDMKTGTGAGMFTVGVLWGFRLADELLDNGAMKLISHPSELIDLLD